MWFLFGEVSSSPGCLGWAALFYCGTPWAFHIRVIILVCDLFVNRDDSLTSKRVVMRTEQPNNFCTTSVTEGEVGAVKSI